MLLSRLWQGVRLRRVTFSHARALSRSKAVKAFGCFPSVSGWSAGRCAALRSPLLRSKRPHCPLLRASQ